MGGNKQTTTGNIIYIGRIQSILSLIANGKIPYPDSIPSLLIPKNLFNRQRIALYRKVF